MHIRLLIDRLIAEAQPRLTDFTAALQLGTWVHTFDPFGTPSEIADELSRLRPEVMVVDPSWLVVSPMLLALLEQADCGHTRTVIGARRVTEVLKVKTAHHGFFDLVDLSKSIDDLVGDIRRIHAGTSLLQEDRVWMVVTPPASGMDITVAPTSQVDMDILELICIGLADKEIAQVVHMSVQSIRNRISSMLKRSGMSNRTQMAWMYANHTLVNGMNRSLETHATQR